MNYIASIQDFFKSPKWGMNWLLNAVSLLIPIVGGMVVAGWHTTGFWVEKKEKNPAEFPAFDFQFFTKYLERGLWPVLVGLIVFIVLGTVVGIVSFVVIFIVSLTIAKILGEGALASLIVMPIILVIQLLSSAAITFVGLPLTLRATLTQDFAKAFDFAFVKQFFTLVKKELAITAIVIGALMTVAYWLSGFSCYLLAPFAFPFVMYAWSHLSKQIYEVYLGRSGTPVPVSPKLTDETVTPPQVV